jgi:hypothetical protein
MAPEARSNVDPSKCFSGESSIILEKVVETQSKSHENALTPQAGIQLDRVALNVGRCIADEQA